MEWSLNEFFRNARPHLDRYYSEHTWFDWGQLRGVSPESHIFNARRLYTAARNNSLGYLLLGDAKIRTSGSLLMNFGLASGNGVSEAQELKQIEALEQERGKVAGPASGPAVRVLGSGSILNDQAWTPMLNDAFILGGVHGGQDFYWTEEGFEQHNMLGKNDFLERRAAFGAAAPQYEAALKRDPAYYKQKWHHYLLGHNNFWSGGLVRIFARELIGLKTFGYKAVFSPQQISFIPEGPRRNADFGGYLNALGAINYFRGDVKAINKALGEFLFDDADALSGLATNAAAPKPKLKPVSKPADWPK